MDYSSSSESSDEEVMDIIGHILNERRMQVRPDPFETYSDEQFRDRYRLSKQVVNNLSEVIRNRLEPVLHDARTLTVSEQLLIALRFYATGSFQILIGDDARVHKSTVCRVVKKVTYALASLSGDFIKMPRTAEEIRQSKEGFFRISGFPNVLGCIDGTHIPITSPGGNHAELFRNRKGYFSVNVQVVCDAKLRIRDIVARWPGSTHDSTIYNGSQICAQLENNEFGRGYLLGDSAYPCTEHVMTPLLNPATQAEERYNQSQIRTRNTVERVFGVWKRRFPCLSLGMRTDLEGTTLPCIIATAVLHNMASNRNEINFDDDVLINEDMPGQNQAIDRAGGHALRRSIINNFFT